MDSGVTVEGIQKRIFLLRGQKVMLSMDLAELYDVEARALVQAVKRNRERFPDDFMFQLNKTEFAHLKSHSVTSSWEVSVVPRRMLLPNRASRCCPAC